MNGRYKAPSREQQKKMAEAFDKASNYYLGKSDQLDKEHEKFIAAMNFNKKNGIQLFPGLNDSYNKYVQTKAAQGAAVQALSDYVKKREKKHNFFCLFSHDKADKISAANNLIKYLNGDRKIAFSEEEASCLRQGDLWKVVANKCPSAGWLKNIEKPKTSTNPGLWLNRR